MPLNAGKLIVFTDLDGTFLDHDSYSFAAAMSAVERLCKQSVPIIPVSSKTLAEIKALNLPFQNEAYLFENGLGFVVGDNSQFSRGLKQQTHIMGHDYVYITKFIADLPVTLQKYIDGFHMMSTEQVADITGLSLDQASLAKSRAASEPFLWSGNNNDFNELKELAAVKDLHITQGGRFYHLMGRGNKAQAIGWIMDKMPEPKPISIALGDGPNDAEMLAAVDYGIKIPNDNGHDFTIPNPKGKIIHASFAGPKGWNAAIHSLLDDLGFAR